jgi:hypothetical protein
MAQERASAAKPMMGTATEKALKEPVVLPHPHLLGDAGRHTDSGGAALCSRTASSR